MSHHQKIVSYYNDTEWDYKSVWHYKLKGPPAIHFGYYDNQANRHADALYRVYEVLADLAGVQPGDKVLDAGCGLGHTTIWLIKNRKAVATGISIVGEQIDKAEQFAREAGIEGPSFIQADYLQTPFEDDYFDVVIGIESVCHAVDKSLFYKEAFRILKPGGRLVIAEYFRGGRPMPVKKEKLLMRAFCGWQILDLDTPEEHTHHAKGAGFEEVKIIDVSENVWISYKNLHKQTRKWLWLVYIIKWIGIINKVRQDNVKSSHLQARALKTKAFQYMHLLAVKPL